MSMFDIGTITGLGAAGDMASSAVETHMNKEIMREQNRYNYAMDASKYQRAAGDLQAAGLNRILAIGRPSTVSAAGMAKAGNMSGIGSKAANTGLAAMKIKAETAKLAASAGLDLKNTEMADERLEAEKWKAQFYRKGNEVMSELMPYLDNVIKGKSDPAEVLFDIGRQGLDVRKSNINTGVEASRQRGWELLREYKRKNPNGPWR